VLATLWAIDAAAQRHHSVNRAGVLAQRPTDVADRLTGLSPLPKLPPLGIRQPRARQSRHEFPPRCVLVSKVLQRRVESKAAFFAMSRSIVSRTCDLKRAISACSGVTLGVVALHSDGAPSWPFTSARTQFVRLALGMPSVAATVEAARPAFACHTASCLNSSVYFALVASCSIHAPRPAFSGLGLCTPGFEGNLSRRRPDGSETIWFLHDPQGWDTERSTWVLHKRSRRGSYSFGAPGG